MKPSPMLSAVLLTMCSSALAQPERSFFSFLRTAYHVTQQTYTVARTISTALAQAQRDSLCDQALRDMMLEEQRQTHIINEALHTLVIQQRTAERQQTRSTEQLYQMHSVNACTQRMSTSGCPAVIEDYMSDTE